MIQLSCLIAICSVSIEKILLPGTMPGKDSEQFMMPGDDGSIFTTRERGQRGRGYIPGPCSICTNFIWLHPVELKEPLGVPEPRQESVLCQPCYETLLVEMRRSSILSPLRLRIAIGLVAAVRSPRAYTTSTHVSEQQDFQREFSWFVWGLLFFAALHLVIFLIFLTLPR
jgi:hypothetical protein